MRKIFIFCLSLISITNAQIAEQGKTLVGVSYETVISSTLTANGYAISAEYLLSNSWSIIGEYSDLQLKGKDVFADITVNISAPDILFSYHFISQSSFDFFLALGLGYTTIQGSAKANSIFIISENTSLLLPQAKIGMRYLIAHNIALRANIGAYRPLAIGVEYVF